MKKYSLIPKDAEKILREQDEYRDKLRAKDPGSKKYWNNFARSIEADLQLGLEGKSADVVETSEGPIVTRRLGDKYPVRSRWLGLCAWQRRTFKTSAGPLFRVNRKPFFFHFNKGGRILTLSITSLRACDSCTKSSLFRLYLFGLTIALPKGRK